MSPFIRRSDRFQISRACLPLPFGNGWISTSRWWNRTAVSSA